MKFSYNWIKSYFKDTLPLPDKLAELLTLHAFEVAPTIVGVPTGAGKRGIEDFILDIDILPNRAHDCFSHLGVAREVSVVTGVAMHEPAQPREFNKSKKVQTTVHDASLTPRISALSIENIEVSKSPEWVENYLQVLGLKPINNIVDATNLVMLQTGQPLHAYDRDKLAQKDGLYILSARPTRAGERLITLDEREHDIPEGTLVITDENRDAPLSIAGIKGGLESKIDETTRNIVVEAANFNPTLIRKTSQVLKLRTDASDRFEKEISPDLTRIGLEKFANLIREINPTAIIEGLADDYPNPQEIREIELPKGFTIEKLGIEVPNERVVEILERLGMTVEERGDQYRVIVPLIRLDLETKEDLAEEIGRIYGYENIISSPLGETSFKPEINKTTYYLNKIRKELIEGGYSEVMTYSFVNKGEVELMNPLASDKNFLRASLLPKLKESYELNKKNRDLLGLKDVKIFEIGKVFKNNQEILMLGKMPDATEIDLDEYIASQPEPTELPNLQTSELLNMRYQPISPYPFITRDVALWVPAEAKPEDIEKIIKDRAGSLLVNLFLFDTFSKEGRVSYAFRLVFQSMDRTLTDEEVNKVMETVTSKLQENPNHQIR